MSDPALRARHPLLAGAGVENELSAQLGAVFVLQIALASARLLLGLGKCHE
jgi:hypothetical protein